MSKPLVPAFTVDPEPDDFGSGTHQVRQVCVDCGAASPTGNGDETLISVKYGWRLSRTPDGAGGYVFEWHCRACWLKAKQARSG